jgi:hypothetical protein
MGGRKARPVRRCLLRPLHPPARRMRQDAANVPCEGNVQCQDGSLTLYAGAESPGVDRESNWLPASGPFSLYIRAPTGRGAPSSMVSGDRRLSSECNRAVNSACDVRPSWSWSPPAPDSKTELHSSRAVPTSSHRGWRRERVSRKTLAARPSLRAVGRASHHRFLPSIPVTGTASRSKSSNSRELTATFGLSKSGLPVDQSGDSENVPQPQLAQK